LPLSDIRPPFLPILYPLAVFLEPPFLLGEVLVVIEDDHDGLSRSAEVLGILLCWLKGQTCLSLSEMERFVIHKSGEPQ
jgi:hypothetical protein